VRDRRQAIDTHHARLGRLVAAAVDRAGERLRAAAGRLEAVSPLAVLARGYSATWVLDEHGRERGGTLVSTAGVSVGNRLLTLVSEGRIRSRVEDLEPLEAGMIPREAEG
jgi:exodeoxyribonuclease VII large subunit